MLSATSVSALITLSGVRSSCKASAVNSIWRRRDCSTGASARWPTGKAAEEHSQQDERPREHLGVQEQTPGMRDPGQAPARDQPAGAVPGHLQPERAGPAGIDRDREAIARLLAAERPGRQHRGARTLRSDRLPGVQQPEEDRRRIGVTVTPRRGTCGTRAG